ncbi:MAG: 2-amino-4-hydroxy-6-hydroxymethyldihydropteridine diphosphokinase [Micromonosporaceae bacterium]
MSRAVLSLGSNLGDRYEYLRVAVDGLRDWLVAVSGVYETPPWGDADQPPYLNAVAIVVDATAAAPDWLARGRELERRAGRQRSERRYGPRTLDVDVIAAWDDAGDPIISTDPELTLPHPRAHLRAFVLRPWLDVEPCARLPGHGWLHDLVLTEPVAADLGGLVARPDISLG